MSQLSYPSHSAEVAIWLDCGPHGRLDLCRVSPAEVEAKHPRHIPPCEADLIVSVDGRPHTQRVSVPDGVSENKRFVTIFFIDEVAPF